MVQDERRSPNWIDPNLSRDLPILRSTGENQELEYKSAFPDQARDLGKEIAAFATSNPGMILLGVSDNGDLVGLDGMNRPDQRDLLVRRIGGICTHQRRPSITPSITFAVEDEKVALAISIPKGSQPVYYCGGIPYVRHIADARPAEPHEVVDLVFSWFASRGFSIADQNNEIRFLVELDNLLVPIIILGEEVEQRDFNPWIDTLKAEFAGVSAELRQYAVSDVAHELKIYNEIEEIAEKAEDVSNYRHFLGQESWKSYIAIVYEARDFAEKLKASRIDPVPLPEDRANAAIDQVIETTRLLASLSTRAKEMVTTGRVETLKADASHAGRILLHLSYTTLNRLDPDFISQLRSVAMDLHLVETHQVFLDGGKSLSEIVSIIEQSSDKMNELVTQIEAR